MISHDRKSDEVFQKSNSEAAKSSTELAQMRTALAVSRNVLAADRTLMAWVRTSLSLDSFGFTLYKILQAVQDNDFVLRQPNTPRNVGLFLSAIGTIAMIMGTIEYWSAIRDLRKIQFVPMWRPSFIMAQFMSLTGVVLFVSIVTRLF